MHDLNDLQNLWEEGASNICLYKAQWSIIEEHYRVCHPSQDGWIFNQVFEKSSVLFLIPKVKHFTKSLDLTAQKNKSQTKYVE